MADQVNDLGKMISPVPNALTVAVSGIKLKSVLKRLAAQEPQAWGDVHPVSRTEPGTRPETGSSPKLSVAPSWDQVSYHGAGEAQFNRRSVYRRLPTRVIVSRNLRYTLPNASGTSARHQARVFGALG